MRKEDLDLDLNQSTKAYSKMYVGTHNIQVL